MKKISFLIIFLLISDLFSQEQLQNICHFNHGRKEGLLFTRAVSEIESEFDAEQAEEEGQNRADEGHQRVCLFVVRRLQIGIETVENDVVGKVILRIWPLKKIKFLSEFLHFHLYHSLRVRNHFYQNNKGHH